ncbi:MAG TPA: DNA-3-methyladenine glycosylase [Bacteroidales bacterium]|nr:DNA-3-methyladenine glycosylase [Bacteroidales bacterium]
MERTSGQRGILVPGQRLGRDFFVRDVLEVAPDLIGKHLALVRDGKAEAWQITETEAYRGEEDLACHARNGLTKRTEVMYREGGHLYMYLIYGMYWMLNVVVGPANIPQAVLIRGVKGFEGPGRLTKHLGLDRSYYGESLVDSSRIWIAEGHAPGNIITTPRIGIDYAGEWKEKPWRFVAAEKGDV